MKPLYWIARATVQELIYERFFHLLLFFLAVSLGLSALLGSLTYTEGAKLTLDFMLGTIHLAMVLFPIFVGISLFHREFAVGSVYLVLSKPVSRASFLLGKYAGQAVIQGVVVAAMIALTLLIRARFEVPLYAGPILQTGVLIYAESLIVAAFTYLFAIHAGAVLTAVSALGLFGLAHFRGPVTRELADNSLNAWTFVRPLLPDLEVFNLKNLAAYGVGLTSPQMGYLVAYALCAIGFFLVAALVSFQHKDIGN